MTNGNGTIKYTTTCKFCGKAIAEAPALDIPMLGDPGKRAKDLQTIMGKHLHSKHPDMFAHGIAFMDEVLSFLVFNAFHHEDPSVSPRIERIRAEIFAQVRKNTFTDAMLEHLTAGFGLDPQEAADVTQALKAVRDACCEFAQYGPAGVNSPAPSPPLILSA